MDYLGNDVVPAGRAPAKVTTLLAAFVGLLLVIGVVGAFTVSGASGRYPSGQPASVVAAAANNVASSGALKADMTMTVHGDRTLTFRITGVLDPAQRVGRLVFDPDANLFSEPVTMLQEGTDVYVQVPEKRRPQTGNKSWAKIEASGLQGAGVSSTGDIVDQLNALSAPGASVTEVGHETVNGAATTHYRASIDIVAAAAKLPASLRSLAAAMPVNGAVPPMTMDVWIDGNRFPRRLTEHFAIAGITADLVLQYSDYSGKVDVAVPAATDVFTLTDPTQLATVMPVPKGVSGG